MECLDMRKRFNQLMRFESQGMAMVGIANDFEVLRGVIVPLVHSTTATITVNYTFDNWKSTHQRLIVIKRRRTGEFEQFSFNINWPVIGRCNVIQFSLCIQQNGWRFVDDNGGHFYSINQGKDNFIDVKQYYVPEVDFLEDLRLNGLSPIDAVIIREIFSRLQGVQERKFLRAKRSLISQRTKSTETKAGGDRLSTVYHSFHGELPWAAKRVKLTNENRDSTACTTIGPNDILVKFNLETPSIPSSTENDDNIIEQVRESLQSLLDKVCKNVENTDSFSLRAQHLEGSEVSWKSTPITDSRLDEKLQEVSQKEFTHAIDEGISNPRKCDRESAFMLVPQLPEKTINSKIWELSQIPQKYTDREFVSKLSLDSGGSGCNEGEQEMHCDKSTETKVGGDRLSTVYHSFHEELPRTAKKVKRTNECPDSTACATIRPNNIPVKFNLETPSIPSSTENDDNIIEQVRESLQSLLDKVCKNLENTDSYSLRAQYLEGSEVSWKSTPTTDSRLDEKLQEVSQKEITHAIDEGISNPRKCDRESAFMLVPRLPEKTTNSKICELNKIPQKYSDREFVSKPSLDSGGSGCNEGEQEMQSDKSAIEKARLQKIRDSRIALNTFLDEQITEIERDVLLYKQSTENIGIASDNNDSDKSSETRGRSRFMKLLRRFSKPMTGVRQSFSKMRSFICCG